MPNYHEWMQDEYLLDVTASEPLTMQQEVEMQQEWRDDEKKCTFIILARDLLNSGEYSDISIPPAPSNKGHPEKTYYPKLVEQTLDAMIGDINLFLSEEEDEVDIDDIDNFNPCVTNEVIVANQTKGLSQAELDIMIARSSHRHRGLGTELALMMMLYGASALGIRRFFVKIKDNNTSSLRLFRDKLGFIECTYAECFGEYEFECKRESADDMKTWIETKWKVYCQEKDTGGVEVSKLYDIYKCPLKE